jgi:hypothetical protein
MDIGRLRYFLKYEYTYEDTTQKIFLDEMERIFDSFRNTGDTELLLYNGACVGKTCENCGMNGYRFVGNISKNYLDLIFEIEGNDIKDIFECVQFETDVDIERLGIKADIDVDLDEKNINQIPF